MQVPIRHHRGERCRLPETRRAESVGAHRRRLRRRHSTRHARPGDACILLSPTRGNGRMYGCQRGSFSWTRGLESCGFYWTARPRKVLVSGPKARREAPRRVPPHARRLKKFFRRRTHKGEISGEPTRYCNDVQVWRCTWRSTSAIRTGVHAGGCDVRAGKQLQ